MPRVSQMALVVNNPPMQETWVRCLGWEYLPEKGKATASSILAWRIPWTEELGYSPWDCHKESDMTGVTQHAHTRIKLYILFDIFILKLINILNSFFLFK